MPRAASRRNHIVIALTDRTNVTRTCNVCWLSFPTRTIYHAHLRTWQHIHAVSLCPHRTFWRPRNGDFPGGNGRKPSRTGAILCRVCSIQCRNPQAYSDHLAGRSHALRLQNHMPRVTARPRTTVQPRQRGRPQIDDSPEGLLARATRRTARAMFFKAKRDRRYFPRAQAERARAETQYKRQLFSARQRSHAVGWAARRAGRRALSLALADIPVTPRRRDDRVVHPCAVCGVTFFKRSEYRKHSRSRGHVAAATTAARPQFLPSWCAMCTVHLSLPHWAAYDKHVGGRAHQAQLARLHDGTITVKSILHALPHA